MSKWMIWTLLEASTLLLCGNLIVWWLSRSLSKRLKAKNSNIDKKSANLAATNNETHAFKRLAHYLDLQINFAANSITPRTTEPYKVNQLKIWGTILRAERAILLNQASDQPRPILNRFLSSLIYALSAPKLQTTNTEELQQSLKEMEKEFLQTAEILITKESLLKNQTLLNDDLRKNIDRATKRVRQLDQKKIEQKRLETEIDHLRKKIQLLEEHQTNKPDELQKLSLHAPTHQVQLKQTRTTSFKQVSSLNSLAERQKMVIEQLKIEIERNNSLPNPQNTLEAQKVAISKMERMSKETQSLIIQLEQELETSNLSIATLRQNISEKDAKLVELEKQLNKNNQTAIGNLETLHANKKETLVSYRDGLSNALENTPHSDSLVEQEKDSKMLERLLLESETCVTLLVQELDTAEETNQQLKEKVNALISETNPLSLKTSKPLQEQREKNRQLVQETTELKDKVASIVSNRDYQELKSIFNRKSLECDRLQLAYSDLEMKYLGTLGN
ncbi:hypothetical protein C0J08_10900 [Marinomonas sp. CT5]|uniref:hypothetical protein n=1 Tax=Marinomonas sp. CT5 TaxID=2066133 RepID=UPI001BB0C639|nr:hypothetical protein [Marinomonas sp. CT5]QUX95895.1 hypothetical protein C0J08_10900 [Marinomonas sp. CT5]